jgi:hypothetical protein
MIYRAPGEPQFRQFDMISSAAVLLEVKPA